MKEVPEQIKMEVLPSYKVQHQLNNHHPIEKIAIRPELPLRSPDKRLENVLVPSGAQEKKHPNYSIQDINKDVNFDKHLLQIQHIYGVKPAKKLGVDMVPQKPIDLKKPIKKEEFDIHNQRNLKLPSLNPQGVEIRPADRLPPLKNDAHLMPSMSKEKIKELSKVYKVRLGGLPGAAERYQNILKSNYKRELSKNHSTTNANEYLDNHMLAKKNMSPEIEI